MANALRLRKKWETNPSLDTSDAFRHMLARALTAQTRSEQDAIIENEIRPALKREAARQFGPDFECNN